MIRDKDEFNCLIYELLIGARNLEEYPVEESEVVQDEFKKDCIVAMPMRKCIMLIIGYVKD